MISKQQIRDLDHILTPAQLPFLVDPEHEARDLRPWSKLADQGLVENGSAGPSRTHLGDAVLELRVKRMADAMTTSQARTLLACIAHEDAFDAGDLPPAKRRHYFLYRGTKIAGRTLIEKQCLSGDGEDVASTKLGRLVANAIQGESLL